jgi:hypothetical protein
MRPNLDPNLVQIGWWVRAAIEYPWRWCRLDDVPGGGDVRDEFFKAIPVFVRLDDALDQLPDNQWPSEKVTT